MKNFIGIQFLISSWPNRAYEIIGDETKRKEYDESFSMFNSAFGNTKYGAAGGGAYYNKPGSQPGGAATGESYSAFYDYWFNSKEKDHREEVFVDFNEYFGFSKGFADSMGPGIKKEQPGNIFYKMDVSFLDAIHGVKKSLSFSRNTLCSSCKGSKCQPNTGPSKCYTCGGKGKLSYRHGPMSHQAVCSKCRGFGAIIKFPCGTCKGTGLTPESVYDEIDIPLGVMSGDVKNFKKKGHFNSHGDIGDLVVTFSVEEHSSFERDGIHIRSTHQVNFMDAIIGKWCTVPTVHGKASFWLSPGTQNGQEITIKAAGVRKQMKKASNQSVMQQGDHLVKIELVLPKKSKMISLIPEATRILKELKKESLESNVPRFWVDDLAKQRKEMEKPEEKETDKTAEREKYQKEAKEATGKHKEFLRKVFGMFQGSK